MRNIQTSFNTKIISYVLLVLIIPISISSKDNISDDNFSRFNSSSDYGLKRFFGPFSKPEHDMQTVDILIRFKSKNSDNNYFDVDTIAHYSQIHYNNDTLLYVTLTDTNLFLIQYPLHNNSAIDTIVEFHNDSNYGTQHGHAFFKYHFEGELYAHNGYRGKPSAWTMSAMLLKIINRNNFDTLIVLDNCYISRFSPDGSEVFIVKKIVDDTDSSKVLGRIIGVYDINSDELRYPLPQGFSGNNPYRPNNTSPLYYMSINNIWAVVLDSIPYQITNYNNTGADTCSITYSVKNDSLFCIRALVDTTGHINTDSTWVDTIILNE